MNKSKTITVKLIKSGIGRMQNHKLCIKGLGFKKLNQTVTVIDSPSNRGMINKISAVSYTHLTLPTNREV